MFISYFVHIDGPFEDVEGRLLALVERLDGLAAEAYREGEAIRAKVGVGREHQLGAKGVHIAAEHPLRGPLETRIPITWEASGTPGLFPRMEGDLLLAAVSPDLTQLALHGTYHPPLGALGRSLDRKLLHRLAELSVKGLVDRIAGALKQDAGTPGSVRHGVAG